MVIGLIGLRRMGSKMVERLRGDGHELVAFDLQKKNRTAAKKLGAQPADSLEALVQQLTPLEIFGSWCRMEIPPPKLLPSF